MAKYRVNHKPLSANSAWKGVRYKTDLYKKYEYSMMYLLPKGIIIPDGKLSLCLVFGFSNAASDLDNPVKQFQDCLSKKYKFNDKLIYRLEVDKVIVPKGKEFIEFEIKPYN
jgi:Holliday junction resolvase RusA-like endonuclease